MNSIKQEKIKILRQKIEKINITGNPAGLARTHRYIKAENDKEVQFLKICSQIRINNFKQKRSERQRNERIAKRKSK